jgi:hypothetical protein
MQGSAGGSIGIVEQPPKRVSLTIDQPPLYLEQPVSTVEESDVDLTVMDFLAFNIVCHGKPAEFV